MITVFQIALLFVLPILPIAPTDRNVSDAIDLSSTSISYDHHIKMEVHEVRVVDGKLEMGIRLQNISGIGILFAIDPRQTFGANGPYVSLDENAEGSLIISSQVFEAASAFYYADHSSVGLRLLSAGEVYDVRFVVPLPLTESIPASDIREVQRSFEIRCEMKTRVLFRLGYFTDSAVWNIANRRVKGENPVTLSNGQKVRLVDLQKTISASLNLRDLACQNTRSDNLGRAISSSHDLSRNMPTTQSPVKVVGNFTNVEGDGEHEWGYSVQIWRQDDRIYGLFAGGSGTRLVGDPPTGVLVDQEFDEKTGRISFKTVLPGTTYHFDGHLTKSRLKGRLLHATSNETENIVLKRDKEFSRMMDEYATHEDWKLDADRILKFRGPRP